jgi:hypothetical protein
MAEGCGLMCRSLAFLLLDVSRDRLAAEKRQLSKSVVNGINVQAEYILLYCPGEL